MIICITGYSGAGKTTVAKYLYDSLRRYTQVYHLSTDDIGQSLFSNKYFFKEDKDFDYTSEELGATYNSFAPLIQVLTQKSVLIVEGMFRETAQRLALKLFAHRCDHSLMLIYVNTPKSVAQKRLKDRYTTGGQGGWVEYYEVPEYERKITITNNRGLRDLELQVDRKVLSKLALELPIPRPSP